MAGDSEVSKKLYPGKKYSDLSPAQKQQVKRTIEIAKKSKKKSSSKKKTIVVGVKTSKSGAITQQENIGKSLSEAQRQEVSSFSNKYGRLTSKVTPDNIIFSQAQAKSSSRIPPQRDAPAPVTTSQGNVLTDSFTGNQTAREVQQADPSFVGPRDSGVRFDPNTLKRPMAPVVTSPQETQTINNDFIIGEQRLVQPNFGAPGTVQPKANVVERFFAKQPESFKGSVGGEVIRQTSNIGRDVVVGSRELSPYSTVASIVATAKGKGEGKNLYKRFQSNFEERKKKFKRETTTTLTAVGIGVGVAAAPVVGASLGVSAATTSKSLLVAGLAADVTFTGIETAKAFINPTPEQKARAILTGGIGVATTIPLVRGVRSQRVAKSLEGKSLTTSELKSSTRDVSVELSGSPQIGTFTKIDSVRIPGLEVGSASASPVFGPSQLIKNTDVVNPDFLFEVRRTRTRVTPLGATDSKLPSTQLATTTDLTTQGIITSDAALTKGKNVLRITGSDVTAPVRVEQEGFVQYFSLDAPSFKTNKFYSDNVDDILAISQGNKRLTSKGVPKQVGYQPKIEYVRDFNNLGLIKVTTDKQTFTMAIDKKTGGLVGELSTKPSIFKVTTARASTGSAGFGSGKIVTASDVIKRRNAGKVDNGGVISGGSTSQATVLKTETKTKTKTKSLTSTKQETSLSSVSQDSKVSSVGSTTQATKQQLVLKLKDPIVKQRSKTKSKSRSKSAISSKSVLGSATASGVSASVKSVLGSASASDTKADTSIKVDVISKMSSATASKSDSLLKSDTRLDNIFKTGIKKSKVDSNVKRLPFISFGKNKNSLFNVFVRRQGEFRKVGASKSKKGAFALGSKIVGTSAAASFKVTDTTGVVAPFNIDKDFYVSTKEQGVVIEKRKRRIKSAGELREITFKGVQASKKNKRRVL